MLGGGGQGLDIEGGKGGQISSRHMTSKRRRCDVTTSHRRHVPTRSLINQCQIIIGRLRKSGGQKIDIISLLLNRYSQNLA